MYKNIDTDHAIKVISWWLDKFAHGLPDDFPIDTVEFAMRIIMHNNIFESGVLRFLHLLGTAMGNLAAVMWTTLYFCYHKVHHLLPIYKKLLL